MRYFATFADTGERLMTLVADGLPLTVSDIITQYPQAIEISEEDQKLYMQGYVRGKNGKPKPSTNSDSVESTRQAKILQIKDMAKAKLVETDHNIVEYFELKNMTDEEYDLLKKQRQAVRDYRDKLIQTVVALNNVEAINVIEFKL
jgi:predicted transcriptional regulator